MPVDVDLKERLGCELKRLLGGEPVRLRPSGAAACFLLSDCVDDAEAGSLIRDKRMLQLVGGDSSAPVVFDIDSLCPNGSQSAAEAVHSSERLVCATRLLDVMLHSRYGIRLVWFSSGKQGVHGFGFGTSLSKQMRSVVAALLPGDETVFNHEAWGSQEVVEEVEAALRHLQTLRSSPNAQHDTEWQSRLQAATAPNASLTTKLMAVTAFFDKGVTVSSQIRVPFAHNAKGPGYAGFLPPRTTSVQTQWPPVRRPAGEPLVESELGLLKSIVLPTSEERRATADRLRVDCERPRKRALSEADELRLQNWVPRLHPRACALPSNAAVREALVQWPIRQQLSPAVLDALERGMRRGGMPPCAWVAEPDDDIRHDVSARGGGTGRGDQPLALEALAGLNLTANGRGAVARALFISAFPVDCFAEAMKASHKVRQDVLSHWGSWFATFAKGGATVGVSAWRYDGGFLDAVGLQCPEVLKQCARAASVLTGRATSGGSMPSLSATSSRRPAAASRDSTGRVVNVALIGSADQQLERTLPALQTRAEREAIGEAAVADRLNELRCRAEREVNTLHAAATNGTLTCIEYIAPDGRLGYSCGGYCGIKSILRELRHIVFAGMWRVDLKRCHTSMLIGAHARAVGIGTAPDHHVLDRMRGDMDTLEGELRANQSLLLPAALTRLDTARGTADEERNVRKYVDYLQMEPKTLLSVMLNHPSKSPMFRNWPLAAACCAALGVAAATARSHPLVAADRLRPQLDPRIKQGSPAEKQRIAILLERRAVVAMIRSLGEQGLEPSITINDEVLFRAPLGEAEESKEGLEEILGKAVMDTLGFNVRLTVEPV